MTSRNILIILAPFNMVFHTNNFTALSEKILDDIPAQRWSPGSNVPAHQTLRMGKLVQRVLRTFCRMSHLTCGTSNVSAVTIRWLDDTSTS